MQSLLFLFILVLAIFSLQVSECQKVEEEVWNKTYGGMFEDYGLSAQQTADGGFIVSGKAGASLLLLKADRLGEEIWAKTFGEGEGRTVQETSDGGFVVTGGTNYPELLLLKTDEQGVMRWKKTFDHGYGSSVQETRDKGFIVTGYSGSGSDDLLLMKTDPNGNELWSKTFGGIYDDYGHSVRETADGSFIIAGETTSYAQGNACNYAQRQFPCSDVFLLKTNAEGNKLWSKTFGDIGMDAAYSVQEATNGGFIITGRTQPQIETNKYSIWLMKTDNEGNLQWSQTFASSKWGPLYSKGVSVQETIDSGFIVVGQGGLAVLLLKTDASGQELWFKNYAGGVGYSVQTTNGGGYIVAGKYGNQPSDIWLIKTDSSGNAPTIPETN